MYALLHDGMELSQLWHTRTPHRRTARVAGSPLGKPRLRLNTFQKKTVAGTSPEARLPRQGALAAARPRLGCCQAKSGERNLQPDAAHTSQTGSSIGGTA
jgi:hypothetical protein